MKDTDPSPITLCFQEKAAKVQEVKDVAIKSLTQAIDDEKKEQWRVEGRNMLFDAKRVRNRRKSVQQIYNMNDQLGEQLGTMAVVL